MFYLHLRILDSANTGWVRLAAAGNPPNRQTQLVSLVPEPDTTGHMIKLRFPRFAYL